MRLSAVRGTMPSWGRLWMGMVGLALLSLASCDATGRNEVSRRLIRPVQVTVVGRVIDASTSAPLAKIDVALERRVFDMGGTPSEGSADAAVTSDREIVPDVAVQTGDDGKFSLQAELDIERYDYNLRVGDAQGLYAVNDGFRVYASRDATIDAADVRLYLAGGEQRVTVVGRVIAAPGGASDAKALEGARVALIDRSDDSRYAAITDAEGKYVLKGVPFRDFELEVRPPLDEPKAQVLLSPLYRRALALLNERQETDAGTGLTTVTLQTVYVPATKVLEKSGEVTSTGMTIVLSWEAEDPACKGGGLLHAELELPGQRCEVNRFGRAELVLNESNSLDPSGFGIGTCMWPVELGGALAPVLGRDAAAPSDERALRAVINAHRRLHTAAPIPRVDLGAAPDWAVDALNGQDRFCPRSDVLRVSGADPSGEACPTAFFGSVATEGASPEILRVMRTRMTTDWPERLGYYYLLSKDDSGEVVRRYPMGFAALNVLSEGECDLDQVRAVVEVYEDDALVGRFERSATSAGGSAAAWTPMVLELGSRHAAPRHAEDLYFRVLPLDSAEPVARTKSYFYQEVGLSRATIPCTSGAPEGQCVPNALGLFSGDSIVPIGDTDFLVTGTGAIRSGLDKTDLLPVMYRQVSPAVWDAAPLPMSDPAKTVVARSGSTLFGAVGDGLSVMAADGRFPSCWWCVRSEPTVFVLDLPGLSSIALVTKRRVTLFDRTRFDGDADQYACGFTPPNAPPEPGLCRPLANGEPALDESAPAGTPITWAGISERRGTLLVGRGNIVWEIGKLDPALGAEDWRAYMVVQETDAQVLSVLDLDESTLVGTTSGLYVGRQFVTEPPNGPASELVYDCNADPVSVAEGREPVRTFPIQALAHYGKHVIVGTSDGLALLEVQEPNDQGLRKACARWFPTVDRGEGALPPFPKGVSVTDLRVIDGELLVLTKQDGLFRIRGGL